MTELLWVTVPYVAFTSFLLGHIWRYRQDQFGWTTRSSQLYESRLLRLGSPLFHFGLLAVLGGHVLGIAIPALVCVALGVIVRDAWQSNSESALAERALIALVEGYEAVMAYISNTLSFLRLAAFSLNHVALAIAIFTLGGMLHATGYWVTVVLGNVFILVLEGGIVAIQAIRLEYYEGFSRFFSGDGRAFQPLALGEARLALQGR